MFRSSTRFGSIAAIALALGASPARASFHFWDIVEVFSTADGSIQFVEFFTTSAFQEQANTATGELLSSAMVNTYAFPNDLPHNQTANTSFLVGTTSYDALAQAHANIPVADYTVPDNFFSTAGDTLTLQWLSGFFVNSLAFTAVELPTDGSHSSLNRPFAGVALSTLPNSPTNFNGDTGSIPALLVGDASNDGTVTADDLIAVQQNFGSVGPPSDGLLPGDADDSGAVTADDLIAVQQNFGATLAGGGGAVPEPATGILVMTILGVAVSGSRARRA